MITAKKGHNIYFKSTFYEFAFSSVATHVRSSDGRKKSLNGLRFANFL